jgi:hypothetical protein
MTRRDPALVRQCLAFRVAGFLGALFAVISAVERDWISLGVALAGTATMVVVFRRRCRFPDPSEPRHDPARDS